jgi:hypothetical protein
VRTLTLVRVAVNGFVTGVYSAPVEAESTAAASQSMYSHGQAVPRSFLFSLRNRRGAPFKLTIADGKNPLAVSADSSADDCGVTFGGDARLVLTLMRDGLEGDAPKGCSITDATAGPQAEGAVNHSCAYFQAAEIEVYEFD